MKRITFISILFFSLFFLGCKTQQDPAKVLVEKEKMDALFGTVKKAIEDRSFVLEANYIVFNYGRTVSVIPTNNFVKLSGDQAVIQIASSFSEFAGPNGMGGVTVEGRASDIEVNQDKKGNITFAMDVSGIGVSARVYFTITNGTNHCTATVEPNFNGRRLTFTGVILPEEQSNIFEGRAL